MDSIDFGIWLKGAVIVVGILEWLKFFTGSGKGKLFSLLLPVASIIVAITIAKFEWRSILFDALGIWAVSHLSYKLIIERFKGKCGNDT